MSGGGEGTAHRFFAGFPATTRRFSDFDGYEEREERTGLKGCRGRTVEVEEGENKISEAKATMRKRRTYCSPPRLLATSPPFSQMRGAVVSCCGERREESRSGGEREKIREGGEEREMKKEKRETTTKS